MATADKPLIVFIDALDQLSDFEHARNLVWLPTDLFYLVVQLFVLESGAVSEPISWELEIARLLAPGVAVYTAVQALAVIFREQLQLLRVRFLSDHAVVCELGRKGLLLVKAFQERGYRVVVIDQDEDNNERELCRERGAIVLSDNAPDEVLLRKARVDKAKYLISVCKHHETEEKKGGFPRRTGEL